MMIGPTFRSSVPWIITCLAVSLLAYSFVANFWEIIRLAHADAKTEIFEDMRQKAAASDSVGEIMAALKYVEMHYPSGTIQITGSRLDRIVERARQSAIREIIAILRQKTGKEFGDDPRDWRKGLSVVDEK